MRLLPISLVCLGLIIVPLSASAKTKEPSRQSYVELGLGVSQHDVVDETSTINKLPMSFVGKVLVGGKIANTSHVWYELMYNYGGKTNYSDTNFEYSSHSVSSGFKLTTTPYQLFSTFARLGAGKTFFSTNANGLSGNGNRNQAYLGLGASYRLTPNQFFNIEYQHVHYFDLKDSAIDENIGSVFLTYQQYMR